MTPKLLVWADAGNRTGFERVAREILTPLHRIGRYDVTVMGIGYRGQPGIKYDYPVYPASTSPGGLLGLSDAPDAFRKHKPDVVWTLLDLWNASRLMAYKPVDLPAAIYYPVDTPNMKWGYALATGLCSSIATYAPFGVRETAAGVRDFTDLMVETAQQAGWGLDDLRRWITVQHPLGETLNLRTDRLERYQNLESYAVIPHGHDRHQFQVRNKCEARARFLIDDDAFVVLSVGTNQFRKRLDLTVRAFAILAEQEPRALLVMHAAAPTIEGWDLQQLVRYYGLAGRVRMIHEESEDELTEDALVDLYNTADVQINTSGGEGWYLPGMEGASCGVPQIVPDWSVTRDLWKDHGLLIPVKDYRMELKNLNTCHAQIDVAAAGKQLLDLARDEDMRLGLRTLALELASQQLPWTKVRALMGTVIDQAIVEPEQHEVSLGGFLTARVGEVKSELAGRPVL